MCLQTKQTTPEITVKDLTVYKGLNDDLTSPSHHFQYALGEEYTAEIGVTHDGASFNRVEQMLAEALGFDRRWTNPGWVSIGPGLHCTLYPHHLFEMPMYISKVVECTIPAGSEIYMNGAGSIVTNKLIVNRIVNSLHEIEV